MNRNYYASSSSLCVLRLQHYKLLKNHMLIHANCAMVFVIHNQSFPVLGRTLPYNFLLDVMTHNTFHSLRLRTICKNNMVINFFKCHILVLLQMNQKNWLRSNSTNNSSLHACSSTYRSSSTYSPRSLSKSSL